MQPESKGAFYPKYGHFLVEYNDSLTEHHTKLVRIGQMNRMIFDQNILQEYHFELRFLLFSRVFWATGHSMNENQFITALYRVGQH